MVNTIKSMAVACGMAVLALGSSSSFAYITSCPDVEAYPSNGCSLPGLTSGSFPYFDNLVSVTSKDKGDGSFDIRARTYKGAVDNKLFVGVDPLTIDKMKFDLNAHVDGEAASGTIKISGNIDGQKISMTADLAGPWNEIGDGTFWGFDTNNMECNDYLNSLSGGCTLGEVVYLNLIAPIGPDAGTKVSSAGRAISSIPVPAAAWLFGSGLLGLIAVSRRRGGRAEG